LARRGYRVVYFEPLASGRGNRPGAREEDGVTVITVPFLKTNTKQPLYNAAIEWPPVRGLIESVAAGAVRKGLDALGVARPDVAFVSNVYAGKALSAAGARLICYDFNDHPLQFAGVPSWAGGYLTRMLSRADVIVAVSAHYARRLRAEATAPVVVIGNGVEFDAFAHPARAVPERVRGIRTPRVGYVGKVSHFLDFGVLERLADHGAFELVVVGPLPDETSRDVSRLRQRAHAHVVGEVPYPEVAAALHGLDVALIPFRAGDPYTVGINPNKLYQYWAAGLPVVSSPIADVSADGAGLSFAESPAAFEEAVLRTLATPPDKGAIRARARAHDWDAIADRLAGLLDAALAAKESGASVRAEDVSRCGQDEGGA
ncbi:MAG: glycosyltransferase, partial [Candidatus Eiseniibacteriota bacterium]